MDEGTRMEQMLRARPLEVEQISGGQRFATRFLADHMDGSGRLVGLAETGHPGRSS